MARQISKRAFDLCVAAEVTSQAYFTKHYETPEWPGLSSGVTVAIGYDLGQASAAKIKADWQGLVSDAMLQAMMDCAGKTGKAGQAQLAKVKGKIRIPWGPALHVFQTRDVPQWTAGVLRNVPGSDKLPPSCLGVLFDIAYNRGHSWSSGQGHDRYEEMRAIKALVTAGKWDQVPAQITSMKRLWPGTAGLLRRCDDRAALWKFGLANPNEPELTGFDPPAPDSTVPQTAGPARTAPPVTTSAQNTTAVVVAAGGAAAAKQAADAGMVGGATAVGIALGAALLGAAVWYIWHRNRNPK